MSRLPAPRLRALLLALLTAWLVMLSACTGTFEEGTPLVLLVAIGPDDAASQVVAFLVEPPGPATPRQVTPLGGADLAADLTLPLRGWDWVDREAFGVGAGRGRTRLVALTSATSTVIADRHALLHRYDVATFEPEAPALAAVDDAPLPLVREGRWDDDAFPVADGVQAPSEGVCLVDVAVDGDGRFAALLDHRAGCRSGESEVGLHVIDLDERRLVWSSTPDDVSRTRPLIDQREGSLDVWQRTPDGYDWLRLDLGTRTLSATVQGISGSAFVDVSATDDERWVLLDGRLQVVSSESAGAPGEASATGTDRRFVATGPGLPVVIIGTNLVVHPSPTQPSLSPPGRAYADGVTDVPDQLSYLLRSGAIDTLDLLLLDPDEPLSRVVSEVYRDSPDAPLLTQPRRVTWFRPRPPPTP